MPRIFCATFFADFFTFFGERRSGNARVLPLETSLFFFDCASTTWMTPLLSIVEPTESRTLFDEVFLTRGAGDFALVPTSSRVDLKFHFRREFVHSLKVPSPLPETCSDWRFYTRSGRQCPSTVSQLHFVLAPELHLVSNPCPFLPLCTGFTAHIPISKHQTVSAMSVKQIVLIGAQKTRNIEE